MKTKTRASAMPSNISDAMMRARRSRSCSYSVRSLRRWAAGVIGDMWWTVFLFFIVLVGVRLLVFVRLADFVIVFVVVGFKLIGVGNRFTALVADEDFS